MGKFLHYVPNIDVMCWKCIAKSSAKLLARVDPLGNLCVCQNAYVIHVGLASNDKSIMYILFVSSYRTYTPFTWSSQPSTGTSQMVASSSHQASGPAASPTTEEGESPIGLPLTGTTTQPSTSVVPTGGTTTQASTSVSTTVPAVSGAPLGAATITQPSQLQLPPFTPAVPSTPWVDPTGLGTANLIRNEVNRIVDPLKREIESLKSKIEKLEKRNNELEKGERERKKAEEIRVGNEKVRITNEKRRNHAEKLRVDGETNRDNEEQGRVSAEKVRVDAERARVAVGVGSSHGGSQQVSGGSQQVSGVSQQVIRDLEIKITRIEDNVKDLENENTRIKNELIQLRTQVAQSAQVPAPPHTGNDVRDWKRRACEEVLELTAPPGRAPLVKAKANHRYNCYDSSCTFQNRTNCLDTYIKHLNDKHSFNIRDTSHTIALRDTYLPCQ